MNGKLPSTSKPPGREAAMDENGKHLPLRAGKDFGESLLWVTYGIFGVCFVVGLPLKNTTFQLFWVTWAVCL